MKVPFAIVSFLLVQGAGLVWYGANLDRTVKDLQEGFEEKAVHVEQHRKFLKDTLLPAFERDNWLGEDFKNLEGASVPEWMKDD